MSRTLRGIHLERAMPTAPDPDTSPGRPPIDFDAHRREAQRLRREAMGAWLDRLGRAWSRRWWPAHPGPAAPSRPLVRPGEPRCPC